MKHHPFTRRSLLAQLTVTSVLFFMLSCKKEVTNNAPQIPPDPYSLTPKAIALSEHVKGFYEYLPQGYSTDPANTKYPLLIFVHGGGEIGGDSTTLIYLLKNGPLKHVQNGSFPTSFSINGKSYKFIIIAPQFTSADAAYPDEMDNIIEYAKKNYKVDVSRIYLTGLSFGGGVCWNYAGSNTAYSKKIAAMVAISSYINEARSEFKIDASKAQTIASSNLPIWSTHNKDDDQALLSWITNAYNLLKSYSPAMNPSPKLTVFNSNAHDAWTTTYDPAFKENNLNIYEWMLQYHR